MMHLVSLVETHPGKIEKLIEEIGKITYKVTDNNGHEIENRVQVRCLYPIDIVVQEDAKDDVLNELAPFIIGEKDKKLSSRIKKIMKYFSFLKIVDKISLPKFQRNPNGRMEKLWNNGIRGKIMVLGSLKDKKNDQGLDRI